MRPIISCLALSGVMLTGCSPADSEANAPWDARTILQQYGGSLEMSEVEHATRAEMPDRYHWNVLLTSRRLGRYGHDWYLPATNCAFYAWHGFSPEQRRRCEYIDITLASPDSSSTYRIPSVQLALVESATVRLAVLLAALRKHDLVAADRAFQRPLRFADDSLRHIISEMANRLAPLPSYQLEGFYAPIEPATTNSHRLVKLVVSIPHPANKTSFFLIASINPAAPAAEGYLYELDITEYH